MDLSKLAKAINDSKNLTSVALSLDDAEKILAKLTAGESPFPPGHLTREEAGEALMASIRKWLEPKENEDGPK